MPLKLHTRHRWLGGAEEDNILLVPVESATRCITRELELQGARRGYGVEVDISGIETVGQEGGVELGHLAWANVLPHDRVDGLHHLGARGGERGELRSM